MVVGRIWSIVRSQNKKREYRVEAEIQRVEEEEAIEQDRPAREVEAQCQGCFAGCTPAVPPSPAGWKLVAFPTL